MTKKPIKVYEQIVVVDGVLRNHLMACYRNHLVIYNDILDYYRAHRSMPYKELKVKLTQVIKETKFTPLISSVLHSEIYYMCKKADFKQKSITDIQYLSTISDGYDRNRVFRYDEYALKISVSDAPGCITLSVPLSKLNDPEQCIYMNLSYSGTTGCFELSVFTVLD